MSTGSSEYRTTSAWVSGFPGTLLDEASAATSQTLCSKVFVSGLDPSQVFAEHLAPEPGMVIIAWAISPKIDRTRREVRTRIAGLFLRRSVYADGRGCTLTYSGFPDPKPFPLPPKTTILLPAIAGPGVVAPSDPAIEAAINQAFAENEHLPLLTKAVVIVHDGRIIGERYAQGIGPDTPLLSHSIAKSVVNALVGVLVRVGKLNVTERAPVREWNTPGDNRNSRLAVPAPREVVRAVNQAILHFLR